LLRQADRGEWANLQGCRDVVNNFVVFIFGRFSYKARSLRVVRRMFKTAAKYRIAVVLSTDNL
jgi:hypothetical protein